jgi:hypothetical protein
MVRAVSGYVCGSFSTLSCGINQEQNRLAVLDQAGLDQAVLDQAGFTQWVLCDGCCLRDACVPTLPAEIYVSMPGRNKSIWN